MKRRNFLSLLGAVGLAPVLPLPAGAAPVAAGYNRYMYGLAVFHARNRASVTAADLVAKLRVNAVTAEAMMGEMSSKGVIAPALNAAGNAMRTIDPHHRSGQVLRNAARQAADWITDADAAPSDAPEEIDITDMEAPDAGQENQDGKV